MKLAANWSLRSAHTKSRVFILSKKHQQNASSFDEIDFVEEFLSSSIRSVAGVSVLAGEGSLDEVLPGWIRTFIG